MIIVFDIETNGLTPSKIHVLSYQEFGTTEVKSITDYNQMKILIASATHLIGHDINRFDIPVLERILEIKINCILIDTLPLSWYLYPDKKLHGLAIWGEFFGIPKPKVDDWSDQPIEVYINRCEEDVKINSDLWSKFWDELCTLYGDPKKAGELIKYLSFKMQCAYEQRQVRWKLDTERATNLLEELSQLKQVKIDALKKVMPKVPVKVTKSMPKVMTKKDGSSSKMALIWFDLLKKHEHRWDRTEPFEYIKKYDLPNPNSVQQVKSWLTSMGWIPETFEDGRPQVRKDGLLCQSVKDLFDKEPRLVELEDLTIYTHRIGILKGFLKNIDEDGHLIADISGLTNTLRFKHRIIVNLPKPSLPYGKDVRGCLIAPEGYVLCGSDMSSLEDRTKQHYMYAYDPEFVKEMTTEGFDPHLDLAVNSGLINAEQATNHKNGIEDHSTPRSIAKTLNYASIYGAAAETIAKKAGVTKQEAKSLLKAYWERNWSVEKIASDATVKTVNGSRWIYNPVSKFWLSLRADKDRFSTLNQSTGVFFI